MYFISEIEKYSSVDNDKIITEEHEFIDDKMVNFDDTTVKIAWGLSFMRRKIRWKLGNLRPKTGAILVKLCSGQHIFKK